MHTSLPSKDSSTVVASSSQRLFSSEKNPYSPLLPSSSSHGHGYDIEGGNGYHELDETSSHLLYMESSSVISYPTMDNKRKLLFISMMVTLILLLLVSIFLIITKRYETSPTKIKQGLLLRVMSFNVWYGGNQINLQDTADIIKDYGADIVGLQEIDANLAELSKLTGLSYFDERRFILSRFPIFNSGAGYRTENGSGSYAINGLDSDSVHAWILIAPGKVIAFANTHFTSDPYGPDQIAAGKLSNEVMDIEISTRGPDYTALAQALEPLVKANTPLFLTGDFNSPSHLDWTEETVNLRPHMKYPFDWPSSRAMTNIGLRDTYREVNSNPVSHPGITFTPGMPSPFIPVNQNLDRIDFIYTSGDVVVLNSDVVDLKKHCSYPSHGGDVTNHNQYKLQSSSSSSSIGACSYPYPSDHSAVLSTVIVKPIDSPWLLNIKKRRVIRNVDDIEVFISIPLEHIWSVVIVPSNSDPKNSTIVGMFNEPIIYRRSVRFGSNPFSVGEYDAVLINSSSTTPYDEMGRVRFTIIEKDTCLELIGSTTVINLSQENPPPYLTIEWKHSPGDRDDFIAIYTLDTVDVNNYLGVIYTGAKFSGSIDFNILDCNIPFEIGKYKAVFMSNDQYVELGRITFEIIG